MAMKTEQEQIEEIMETLLAHEPIIDVPYEKIYDIAIALAKEGYGNISEYKAEIEDLKADNQELATALKQSDDNYSRAYEILKAQGREIGKLKDENEALKNDLINSEGNLNHITTEIERLKEETSNIRKETAKEIYEKTKEKDSYLLVWEYGEGYLDCLKNLGEVISEYGVEV